MSVETEKENEEKPPKMPPLRVREPHTLMPDELVGVDDFTYVCRICAIVSYQVYPIFTGEGLKHELADKIRRYLHVKVSPNDGLPSNVCYHCARLVLRWSGLCRSARLSDLLLRRRLELRQGTVARHADGPKPSDTAGAVSGGGKYVDAATDPPPPRPQRICSFCPLTLPNRKYNNHIIISHTFRVFRCDECHSYLNKDDVLFHMSHHSSALCSEHVKQEYYKNEARLRAEEAEQDRLDAIERKRLDDYYRKREEARRLEEDEKLRPKNQMIPMLDETPIVDCSATGEDLRKIVSDCIAALKKRAIVEREFLQYPQTDNTEDSSPSPPKKSKKDPTIESEKKPTVAPDDDARVSPDDDDNEEDDGEEDDDADTAASSKGEPAAIEKGTEKSPKASRTCPICGKEYRASSSYFYHMKYFHKRSREHECTTCGKKFGTKANLAQHASIHTGAYDLECKDCGKRFRSKPSLYIHEQSHGGAKRWACGQCDRSFRWRTHLARHAQRHAAARAHVCGACGRGFSVRCDLLRHARTHAAAEFHCAQCGLKFAQKRYLKVHMIKKHAAAPAVVTRS